MSPENCISLVNLVKHIANTSVDPKAASAQLTIVRDMLLDDISASATLAPLHTPYFNPRSLFPFAMLPSPNDLVQRCDLNLVKGFLFGQIRIEWNRAIMVPCKCVQRIFIIIDTYDNIISGIHKAFRQASTTTEQIDSV